MATTVPDAAVDDFDQCAPIVVERSSERAGEIVRVIDPFAVHAERLRNGGEVWIGEIGAEGHETSGFHLELHEAKRAVVEHDDFHRKAELLEGDEIAEHHRDAPVA